MQTRQLGGKGRLYGLRTRREVGRLMNLSEWQVERIERRARRKLKSGLMKLGFSAREVLSTLNPRMWENPVTKSVRERERGGEKGND